MAVFTEDLKPETIRPIVEAIREFHDHHLDPKSRESGELVRALAGLNAQLVAHLQTDAEATAVVAELLTKTSALALAGNYAHFLERDTYGYGRKSLDIKTLSAAFDARIEKELMSLGAAVFQQPMALLTTLIRFYSDKPKLWGFITAAAGNDPENWAKLMMQYVLFWQHGSREVDTQEISKAPPAVLQHAFNVLTKADISQFSEYEQGATRTFTEWWSQVRRSQPPPPNPNP
jgi:hypothetical protein